jgi:hypothetical protein
MTNITKTARMEVGNTSISVYLDVPFPVAFTEAVGCVLAHGLILFLDVDLVGGGCAMGNKEKTGGEGNALSYR